MATIKSSDLAVNQPVETASPDSSLTVEIDASSPLTPGTYQFQLVVTDDAGNTSTPAVVQIAVLDDQAPTAIIDAPSRVGFGKNFTLSGNRSTDIGGGVIKTYKWTLIQAP